MTVPVIGARMMVLASWSDRVGSWLRRGKYLMATLERDGADGGHWGVHLRMTGQFFILDGYVPDKHVHLTFDFEGAPPPETESPPEPEAPPTPADSA